MYSSLSGLSVRPRPISSLSSVPFARKMMIHPYSRMSELVQNGIMSSSITRFFHCADSFAIK